MGVYLRKERAGGTSLGHVWDKDGDVVEVPDEDALALLAVKDGGFSRAEAPAPKRAPKHVKADEAAE